MKFVSPLTSGIAGCHCICIKPFPPPPLPLLKQVPVGARTSLFHADLPILSQIRPVSLQWQRLR